MDRKAREVRSGTAGVNYLRVSGGFGSRRTAQRLQVKLDRLQVELERLQVELVAFVLRFVAIVAFVLRFVVIVAFTCSLQVVSTW